MTLKRLPPDDPRETQNRAHGNLACTTAHNSKAYLEDLCFNAQQFAEKAVNRIEAGGLELIYIDPPFQRLEEWVEVCTGDFIFVNEWQSFRTKKYRSLELTSPARDVAKDKKQFKMAMKVINIFGNASRLLLRRRCQADRT